jgi:predicted secreted Zn-dependent protease
MKDICTICHKGGTEIVCKRCFAPHHRNCWEYYQSCAVYGCDSTEYAFIRVPKVKKRRKFKEEVKVAFGSILETTLHFFRAYGDIARRLARRKGNGKN